MQKLTHMMGWKVLDSSDLGQGHMQAVMCTVICLVICLCSTKCEESSKAENSFSRTYLLHGVSTSFQLFLQQTNILITKSNVPARSHQHTKFRQKTVL
jgi:hypothetical protein